MQVAALSPATSHPPRGIFSLIVLLESATCLCSLLVSLRRKIWLKMGTRWQFRSLASMLMLDGFGGPLINPVSGRWGQGILSMSLLARLARLKWESLLQYMKWGMIKTHTTYTEKKKKRREEKKRKGKERNEMGTKAHKVCENSKCGFWRHMYLFVHI